MKKLLKSIIKLTLFILFLICVMTGIDYYRMVHGKVPIFNQSYYNSKTRTQTYKGIFYVATREYFSSTREPLNESSNLRFYIFSFALPLPSLEKKMDSSFQIETKEKEGCSSEAVLYYADLDQKIYLYCISDIQVIENEKKDTLFNLLSKGNGIMNKILDHMDLLGIYDDQTTLMFQSNNDSITNLGLTAFQCNSLNVNDIYIGPLTMGFHDDFCTYKDDDFSFIYTVSDETPDGVVEVVDEEGNIIPEVFYEDEIYRYEFQVPKSSYVFIKTPAVRGKDETKTPLLTALSTGMVTIEDVEKKGLEFQKIDKAKELEELQKAQEEDNNLVENS